jgi:tRNA(adenine34) deaminase
MWYRRAMSPEDLMGLALEQARLALEAGEVPIGAVITIGDEVIARGFNQPISARDPTAHAEVIVLREAARTIGNYRLTNADVYVTVEPCLMCVGALVHARVRNLVYGAPEPKTGALVSTMRAFETAGLNHRFEVTGGIRADEARDLLQQFFRDRRPA